VPLIDVLQQTQYWSSLYQVYNSTYYDHDSESKSNTELVTITNYNGSLINRLNFSSEYADDGQNITDIIVVNDRGSDEEYLYFSNEF
jgi:hypothetical protein